MRVEYKQIISLNLGGEELFVQNTVLSGYNVPISVLRPWHKARNVEDIIESETLMFSGIHWFECVQQNVKKA